MKGLALAIAALAALLLAPAALGANLAFVGVSGSSVGVYTVPSTGGTPTQIGSGDGGILNGVGDLSWSPTGSQLAFSQSGRLYVVASAGGTVKPIPVSGTAGGSINQLSWSPNGKQFAFAGNGIYVVGSGGGTPKQIVAGTKPASNAISYPEWAPSGSSLYYLSAQISSASFTTPPPVTLRSVSSSGRNGRSIPVSLPPGWNISGFWIDVSADGSMLALNVTQRTPSPAGSVLPYVSAPGTAIVSSSGGIASVLTGFTEASFSPDGTQLCASRSGSLSVITTGGTVVANPAPGLTATGCQWQPGS
jgi:Tol biopolymer transport system component